VKEIQGIVIRKIKNADREVEEYVFDLRVPVRFVKRTQWPGGVLDLEALVKEEM